MHRLYRQYAKSCLALGILFMLSGCGSDTTTSTTEATQPLSQPITTAPITNGDSTLTQQTSGEGYYIDTSVEGLAYQCGKFSGITDNNGGFQYEINQPCEFKVGALTIRQLDAAKLQKIKTIVVENDVKVAQLLLAIDTAEYSNQITIDPTIAKVFKEDSYFQQVSFETTSVSTLLEHTKESLETQGIFLTLPTISQEDVVAHLQSSFRKYCNQEGFVLTNENNSTFLGECNRQASMPDTPQPENNASQHPETPSANTPDNNRTKNPHTSIENNQSTQEEIEPEIPQDNETDTRDEEQESTPLPSDENTTDTETTQPEQNPYGHLPKKEDITDAMAVKFLNMATFGATKSQIEEFKNMGAEAWVEYYLNMPYDEQQDSLLRKVIKRCTDIDYYSYDTVKHTVDEWLGTGITYRNQLRYFNQRKINGIHEIDHHFSLLFDQQIRGRNQLRQRVAYALSQIVIASESNDNFFHDRGEALSLYYDILMKYAFGKYRDLLYDVSLSPTMATFLTYANNPKKFVDPETNSTILPDENYGREIMQLFTIGLYQLNMDGTQIRENGQRVPTYTQEDVNNMSRVFTGLYYNNSQWGDTTFAADMTHPLACNQEYHDSEEKKVLGFTLQGSSDCMQEVAMAIDMLMTHSNVAPFIAKKLILRLTKSNPTTAYVQRVAEVFAATQGDLKATIKAVLLDEEIWKDITEDRGTKIKEPYLAFTQMVRALEYKPLPSFYWTIPSNKSETQTIENPGFILDAYTRFPLYAYFGEFPTQSPSVFNFYDDAFQPDDDEFKIRGFVAPEMEIITPKYAVAYNNFVSLLLYEASVPRVLERYGSDATPENNPKAYHASRTYMYQEYTEAMPIADANHFYDGDLSADEKRLARERIATSLVDLYSQKLLGKKLDNTQREAIINYYKNLNRWSTQGSKTDAYRRREFVQFFVRPIILDILHTDTYMVN